MYLNHIILNTGAVHQSPREEVDGHTLQVVRPWLAEAIASDEPIPMLIDSHMSAKALAEAGLVVTVYAPHAPHKRGKPHRGQVTPLVTFAVAKDASEAGYLWGQLAAVFKISAKAKQPSTPWLAVQVHAALVAYPQAIGWLSDFERCVAWAHITQVGGIKGAV